MQMQNGKRRRKPSSSGYKLPVDPDFASLLYEDRFEKVKPVIKWLFVAILIVLLGWGGFVLFANNSGQKSANSEYSNSAAANELSAIDGAAIFSECMAAVQSEHDAINESDSDFYPKLIAVYDKWLVCYDEYPEATGRLSIESARQSAIDASGEYKNTYLSTNSYEYKPTVQSSGSSSTSSNNDGSSGGGSSLVTPPKENSGVDTRWCTAKKTEVDSLYASYQDARSKVSAVDTEIQKVSYSRPPGFTGTQAQLEAWRASERQRLTNEKTPLLTQQNSTYTAYSSANSEYRSKGCS